MKSAFLLSAAVAVLTAPIHTPARVLESKPADPAFEAFLPLKAPVPKRLQLERGDRLAICGDSITEQKMYSRIIEDYLTMCVPQLEIRVRQYGWSGERAPGFLARMTNDCLRFKPTIATTCYGMNDHAYRPYDEGIGLAYRTNSRAIIQAFKAHGARVIHGSPGCVGKMPHWVKTASGTVQDLNLSLCNLRNIGIYLAQEQQVGFADVFWPMLTAGVQGRQLYGTNFAIAGADGVHPAWAGHTVMAYAFLKAMGLDGDIGTFSLDLGRGKMKTSKGHELVSAVNGQFQIRSSRYPFSYCLSSNRLSAAFPACETDDPASDNSMRAATTLIPFTEELNRFILRAERAPARRYAVTWGDETRGFSAEQLLAGINLAAEFPLNPFSEQFAKVDAAIAQKQAFETKQIKQVFHGDEGKADMEAAVNRTEYERVFLVQQVRAAFVPVVHTLTIREATKQHIAAEGIVPAISEKPAPDGTPPR